jgi:hypothetical protein
MRRMADRVLVVTGMHRSGTSLVASMVQRAGVHVGDRLLDADRRNPRGFFEDVDFYAFHQQALAARGENPYVGCEFVFDPTPAEVDEAARLAASRAHRSLWGFKDPRACLFLEFWRARIPEARFLFLYRHPLEVLASLVRRGEPHTVGLLEGLQTWAAYNLAIQRFVDAHPAESFLCHAYAAAADPCRLAMRLNARWDLDLDNDGAALDSVYQPAELKRLPLTETVETIFDRLDPVSARLYADLQTRAELPDDRPPVEGAVGDNPDVDVLAQALAVLSAPHPPSRVRGCLVVLLAALEQDLMEGLYSQHGAYVRDLETTHERLVATLAGSGQPEGEVAERRAEMTRLREALTVQTTAAARFEAALAAREDALARQTALAAEQQKRLSGLEGENARQRALIDALEARRLRNRMRSAAARLRHLLRGLAADEEPGGTTSSGR